MVFATNRIYTVLQRSSKYRLTHYLEHNLILPSFFLSHLELKTYFFCPSPWPVQLPSASWLLPFASCAALLSSSTRAANSVCRACRSCGSRCFGNSPAGADAFVFKGNMDANLSWVHVKLCRMSHRCQEAQLDTDE